MEGSEQGGVWVDGYWRGTRGGCGVEGGLSAGDRRAMPGQPSLGHPGREGCRKARVDRSWAMVGLWGL